MLSLALALACTRDFEEGVSVEAEQSAKVVRFSDKCAVGSLIVRFDEQATTRVEAGVSRSESTRSGIESLDAILERIGATRIERVFISNRFEERLRNEGMHCWYTIYFDENVDVESAAAELATVAEVQVVQLNSLMEYEDSGKSSTFVSNETVTRASSLYPAFNDPQINTQWHYINIGDTGVYAGVKKGADANIGEAWDIVAGDNRIIVAVIDNNVKYDHPDLAENMWYNEAEKNGVAGVDDDNNGYVDDIYGANFALYQYNKESTLMDNTSDHGTHVAGTVAAVNNNGIGVCGVAGGTGKGDGVRIMSCQSFCDFDTSHPLYNYVTYRYSGNDTGSARAFQYAAENGAAIAQCSWGYTTKYTADNIFTPQNSALRVAIDYFVKYGGGEVLSGGIPIFAAGNSQFEYPSYPGAYRDYICVTSMSCDYTPAYYTNYGPGSTLAAPGGDLLQAYLTTGKYTSEIYSTTYVDGALYGYKQGTSMACPHVSGIAALVIARALQLGVKLTTVELRDILACSTHNIDQYCTGTKNSVNGNKVVNLELARFKGKMGVGYIDAYKALMNVEGIPCITVRTGSKVSVDISDVIGGNPAALTFVNGGVSLSQTDVDKIGLEGDITISSTGKMQIKCTKPGSVIAKISFIAGGNAVGSNSATGGMAVTRKVAILSRPFATNGGWL